MELLTMTNIKQSRFVESAFLFLVVGSLMLFSLSISKAQNTSARCEKGYVYDQVYDQVYEPEVEPVYNPSNRAWQTRTVWKYKLRLVWKCVPNESNSEASGNRNSPTVKESFRRAAEDSLKKAQDFQQQEKYREAVKEYTSAIFFNPNYTEAYFGRGNSKFALKDYRGALADYNQCIQRYLALEAEDKARKAKGRTGINFDLLAIKADAELAYYNRGVAKEILDDRVGACEDFRSSCRMGNSDGCKASKKACKSR
jgi:tetratricopeptide (TPR) repeat protein